MKKLSVCALTKNMALFGALLASINLVHGMDRPDLHITFATRAAGSSGSMSFVQLNGRVMFAFPAPRLAIMALDGVTAGDGRSLRYVVVDPRSNAMLGGPVSCPSDHGFFGFSPSGAIVHLLTIHDESLVVDARTRRRFMVPGGSLLFSPDEDFFTVFQRKDGEYYQVLFDMTSGQRIASIRGIRAVVSTHAPIMLVGMAEPGNPETEYALYPCVNPVLVRMGTGAQIGERLVGRDPQFSSDGKFVLLQQRDPESGAPLTVFYSVDTGVLVKKLAGRVESFVGEDLAALLGSVELSATLPTAENRG